MKSLKDIVRKTIAHKHLGKEMIGAITINEVKKFFLIGSGVEARGTRSRFPNTPSASRDPESPDEELIRGYVKFNKIFIKTQDQGIKIEMFKKKQDILARVNEALAHVGYATKMVEIILK